LSIYAAEATFDCLGRLVLAIYPSGRMKKFDVDAPSAEEISHFDRAIIS